MNQQEAAALLAIAAAFDNRKPDPDAAKAWSVALGDIRFVDARDAVVAHYRGSSEWLMPQQVIAAVKRIRAKRLAETPMPEPPPELADNPAATIAWMRDTRRRIADGDPPDATYGELRPRDTNAIRALMPKTTKEPT